MNIFLIGYRCTGKTSVGKLLAQKLKYKFLDTDILLQKKEKDTISSIVEKKGWQQFRDLESKYLKEASEYDDTIISTGGGIIEKEENIELMKKNGIIVWLTASVQTIRSRLAEDLSNTDSRPALTGKSSEDEIEDVLKKRNPIYKKSSLVSIDTDSITLPEIADSIIEKLKI